jgi:hypothetical protein
VVAAPPVAVALALLHVAQAMAVVVGAHNVAASPTHRVAAWATLATAPLPGPRAKSATKLATPLRSAGAITRMTPTFTHGGSGHIFRQ